MLGEVAVDLEVGTRLEPRVAQRGAVTVEPLTRVDVLGGTGDGRDGTMSEADQVPDDIALAGFDDIPMARYLTPALTTVHVDMLQLGERAVALLLDPERAAANPEGRHEVLPTRLVVRGSCGADRPRGAGPAWDRGSPHPSVPR
jgi:hypothetical protein